MKNKIAHAWRPHNQHTGMVLDADLNYPIILLPDGVIGDGRHRLVRAMIEGRKNIKYQQLTEWPPSMKTDEER
ncbi:MAG: hypothetical protein HRT36_02650 [Alphaproteobacteria bacterium]|nr:hypothetical protein [Alphaproteobacteria bacterium]